MGGKLTGTVKRGCPPSPPLSRGDRPPLPGPPRAAVRGHHLFGLGSHRRPLDRRPRTLSLPRPGSSSSCNPTCSAAATPWTGTSWRRRSRCCGAWWAASGGRSPLPSWCSSPSRSGPSSRRCGPPPAARRGARGQAERPWRPGQADGRNPGGLTARVLQNKGGEGCRDAVEGQVGGVSSGRPRGPADGGRVVFPRRSRSPCAWPPSRPTVPSWPRSRGRTSHSR